MERRKTDVWTIEDGAYTLEEPTSKRNDVDEILYKRVAENDGSDSKTCDPKEKVTHKKEIPRAYCTEEKRKEIARKVVFMYSELENFLECDEYTEDLRIELNESYPDYLKTLQKRKKDMEHTDHGIVISGETCSGKSTLINKLLGKSVFIGTNLESTSTICKIRNSDRIKVTTCSSEKKTNTIDLTNRCDLNTKEGLQILKNHLTEFIDISQSGKCSQFQFVDVGFPIPLLKGNAILLDTPGIGGSGEASLRLKEYIPDALFVIFVINAGNAGGIQHDRISQILKEITFLQVETDMPCFDPEDVIFITNKWDTIYHDDDLEGEISRTWKSFLSKIKQIWPSVKQENIFKMNLRDVAVDSYKNNDSMSQFKLLRRMLDSHIPKAEIKRIVKHLRFMLEMFKSISTGFDARIELRKQTEKQQLDLATSHQKKIKELKQECIEINTLSHQRTKQVIEDIAQEVYDFMSTGAGKQIILNPPDRRPIITVYFVNLEEEIKARVMQSLNKYLRSEKVFKRFEEIRGKILDFYQKVSSDLSAMETDWTRVIKVEASSSPDWELRLPLPIQIPVIIGELILAVAACVVLSPVLVPFTIYMSMDSTKRKTIEEKYQVVHQSIRAEICAQLESNCGELVDKLIDKITNDLLPRRINSLEIMIPQLRKSRDEIIAKGQKLDSLAMKVRSMHNSASELYFTLSTLT